MSISITSCWPTQVTGIGATHRGHGCLTICFTGTGSNSHGPALFCNEKQVIEHHNSIEFISK